MVIYLDIPRPFRKLQVQGRPTTALDGPSPERAMDGIALGGMRGDAYMGRTLASARRANTADGLPKRPPPYRRRLNVFAHMTERRLLQPRHLGLGDADFFGHLHLGFPFEKS